MAMWHREIVGLKKLGNPQGFKFFQWEFIGTDAVKLTGSVVTRTYSKGPRKGKPVFEGTKAQVVVVTEGEEATERARFEAETGKCGECMGDGKRLSRWHHVTGSEYKPCRRCEGSGVVGAKEGRHA